MSTSIFKLSSQLTDFKLSDNLAKNLKKLHNLILINVLTFHTKGV